MWVEECGDAADVAFVAVDFLDGVVQAADDFADGGALEWFEEFAQDMGVGADGHGDVEVVLCDLFLLFGGGGLE